MILSKVLTPTSIWNKTEDSVVDQITMATKNISVAGRNEQIGQKWDSMFPSQLIQILKCNCKSK